MSREKLSALGGRISRPDFEPSLKDVRGLGPARSKLLNKAGIFSPVDLLLHLPRNYDDRRTPVTLGDLYSKQGSGRACTEVVVIAQEYFFARGRRVPKIWVEDSPRDAGGPAPSRVIGRASLLLFGRPFLAKQMLPGSRWLLAATVNIKFGELQSSSFEIAKITEGQEGASSRAEDFFRISPVYPRVEGISGSLLKGYIQKAADLLLPSLEDDPQMRGGAFVSDLRELGLPDLSQALKTLHYPENPDDIRPARRRLAYAELQHFILQQRRSSQAAEPAAEPAGGQITPSNRDTSGGLTGAQRQLRASLPFELTGDQLRAVEEINADLAAGGMQRLLQGDVGSGKTLVALLAALFAVESGGQVALMVPTEILARQHFKKIGLLVGNLERFRGDGPFRAVLRLLTAALSPEEQKAAREDMKTGVPGIYLGTHSLFSTKVEFADLRLVIIDEQHRFGVNQRAQLRSKAQCDNILMLSATPIPRTLTLTIFGNMSVSTIRNMPRGRKPIITHLAALGKEEKVYKAIEQRLNAGEQSYFVYPRIEDPEDDDDAGTRGGLKSAEGMLDELRQRFPGRRIGLVHGRLDAEQREETMDGFASGEIDVLVATTVIEVGVDVPRASAIVIEHAERFGLSALHQLRGRVGRGELQSYCYLVYDPQVGEDGKNRLMAMKNSTDGFAIAEEDLRIRGPGNISGVEQSGYLELEFASLYDDLDLIEELSRRMP